MDQAKLPSSSRAISVVWVLMKHGVWWPTAPVAASSSQDVSASLPIFEQQSSRLDQVTIIGLHEIIVVDKDDQASVQHLQVGCRNYIHMCTSQTIPDSLKEKFSQSIAELESQHPIEAVEGISATDIAPASTSKRRDVVSWDDYFMAVAFLSSLRSKDPSTQVGACIVNEDMRIVGIGYNGIAE